MMGLSQVLVSSWINGEKLNQSRASDVRALCSTLLNCYLMQLLETGFLHADPHPGNLMRTPEGKIVILDFGLITEVSEEQRITLVEFIAHLTLEDWPAIARDLVGLGFFPDGLPKGEESIWEMAPLLKKVLGQIVKGGGLKGGFDVMAMTGEFDHMAREHKVCIPSFFGLVLRAFTVIEGMALKADPHYAIVQECLPYLSRRLLKDNNPRMRAALHQILYGDKKRVDLQRLQKLMSALTTFTSTSVSTPLASGPTLSSVFDIEHTERVKSRPRGDPTGESSQVPPPYHNLNASAASGYPRGPLPSSPTISEPVKEALKVIFAKEGSYAQELIAEELVASVDAMSREALGEALKMVLGSTNLMGALGGPFKELTPLPLQLVTALAPSATLSEEDRQALHTLHTLLSVIQPHSAPSMIQGGQRAAAVATELAPLVPEIWPGVRNTLEMFTRQLVRRMALRLAEDLDPTRSPHQGLDAARSSMQYRQSGRAETFV